MLFSGGFWLVESIFQQIFLLVLFGAKSTEAD